MKTCTACHIAKEEQEFYKDSRRLGSVRSTCKKCVNNRAMNYFKSHKLLQQQARKVYLKKHPWLKSYYDAKYRCQNTQRKEYLRYGGRGIKFNLTVSEIKKLWFRDVTSKMKCPSIDRKDNNGNYTASNCRFIEKAENTRLGNVARWEKKI